MIGVDDIIAKLSSSQRARIAADLEVINLSGEFWDPKTETMYEVKLEKRTLKFLEQLVDALRAS